jgi:sirohydrochlorin cobaltochelatase
VDRRIVRVCICVVALMGTVLRGAEQEEKSMKQGILLVAFGTSSAEARVAFTNTDRLARKRFAGLEIRWAYTSDFIRRKLARAGEVILAPEEALRGMHAEGFTHVAVQSLHVAAGAEFHDLARTVSSFRTGEHAFAAITLGKPLLMRRADLDAVVAGVLGALPERRAEDAVVLMGHGNAHGRGDMAFLASAASFLRADSLAFLGTVEGQPTLADVLGQLDAQKPARAFLVPFMLVAGAHARNDLAGADADSWKSIITARGIACVAVLRGMGECDAVVDVWLDHLAVARQELGVEGDE